LALPVSLGKLQSAKLGENNAIFNANINKK
jgi:hypothetical protein